MAYDTEALLIFYLDEAGADRAQELPEKTQEGEIAADMNIVNLAEFCNILARRDPEHA